MALQQCVSLAMDECVLVEKIYREEGISTQPSALSQPNVGLAPIRAECSPTTIFNEIRRDVTHV
jgi:hypothetical protein